VVGDIVLIIVAILVLGSGKFFEKRYIFVMFFEGSVNGLNVGAPVTFKGVKIGTVKDIQLRFNVDDKIMKIPVYVEFDPGAIVREGAFLPENLPRNMNALIDRGLRATLQMQSLITGLLMIELDFYPDKPAKLTGYEIGYMEIPTISSGLDQMLKKVEKIPLDELVRKLTSAIEGIDRTINSPKLTESINSMSIAMKDIEQIMNKINNDIGPITKGVNETVRDVQKLVQNLDSRVTQLSSDLDRTITAATGTLQELQQTAAGESPLSYRLAAALEDLSAAARSLRELTDTLERNPESLLRGKRN
jgi:paraquat-inducible protein B